MYVNISYFLKFYDSIDLIEIILHLIKVQSLNHNLNAKTYFIKIYPVYYKDRDFQDQNFINFIFCLDHCAFAAQYLIMT